MLVLAALVWLITRDLPLAITILVLAAPGALVIGVPVSNVAGIGNGARNGVLLKGSEVIGDFSKVDTFIFDKTGTLTVGKPEVVDMELYGEKQDLGYLAAVESESDHPLAKAIVKHLGKRSPMLSETRCHQGRRNHRRSGRGKGRRRKSVPHGKGKREFVRESYGRHRPL